MFECLKPKLEYICSKIQDSLENVTDETKEHHSGNIEAYAKVIHEMLKYIEGNEHKSEEPFTEYFQAIISRIGQVIAKEGREIVVLKVQADADVEKQFEKCQEVCESVKDKIESVVTVSLPGEGRIFWPYRNVQFYIREGNGQVIN